MTDLLSLGPLLDAAPVAEDDWGEVGTSWVGHEAHEDLASHGVTSTEEPFDYERVWLRMVEARFGGLNCEMYVSTWCAGGH